MFVCTTFVLETVSFLVEAKGCAELLRLLVIQFVAVVVFSIGKEEKELSIKSQCSHEFSLQTQKKRKSEVLCGFPRVKQ